MPKRYIRLLMFSVMVFQLTVLTVIIWNRAELAKEELRVKSEDTAPDIYPLVVQTYASIEGSKADYAAPTSERKSVEVEKGDGTPPVSGDCGRNYMLSTVSDSQSGGNLTETVNVVYDVRLTAYCPCEICCGCWVANRPVDEYGNKIVYTSTGALAVQGETVAVNPQFIPHGSYVYVQDPYTEEWREYRATDTSGQMNHVDIYFNDHTAALHSGYGGYGTVCWSAGPLDTETLAK